VVDAAAFSGNDKQKLMALVQNQQGSDDDDEETGAPAPDSYKSHSGGILDVLADMKEKPRPSSLTCARPNPMPSRISTC
jgi:hypothetical protein